MSPSKEQDKNLRTQAAREATDYPEVHPARRAPEDGAPVRTLVFLHGGNVGNWSWDPQVLAFGDVNILTLHLPAFGARFEESWEGLESAADDVAALIADEVSEGGAHLVGISLGGVIALHVAARHPELVESVMVTGTPVTSPSSTVRAMHRMQLRLIGSEWYWRFQAGAYGMVDDERDLFAEHGVKLRPENLRAIMDELDPGALPAGLEAYTGPLLALAGAKEPKLVVRSFDALREAAPQAITRVVPGMHHQWNIENPLLFNSVLRRWIGGEELHQVLVDPQETRARTARPARAGSAEHHTEPAATPQDADVPDTPTASVPKSGSLKGKLDQRKLDLKKSLSKKPPIHKRPTDTPDPD